MTRHSEINLQTELLESRRRFIRSMSFLPAGLGLALLPINSASAQTSVADSVKALCFDVFGTVVDWRSSIIREGQLLAARKGYDVDWAEFADRWRGGYGPGMDRVRNGELPWTKVDDLHRMALDELVEEYQLEGMSEAELDHFNKAWHRLSPWPDTVGGLNRLKTKYILATLSNGNVSLLTNMAKNAGMPWDAVLSAELSRHYKPDPEAYLTAADCWACPRNRYTGDSEPPHVLNAPGVCDGHWSVALAEE